MESKKVLLEKVKRLDLEGLWKEAELKFEGKTYVATFKQFDEVASLESTAGEFQS